eukprot:6483841-Amphidinium_carterae.1
MSCSIDLSHIRSWPVHHASMCEQFNSFAAYNKAASRLQRELRPKMYLEIMEVFGGEGRTTVVLHQLAPKNEAFVGGTNFDAIVGWDLLDENDVHELWQH